MTTQTEESRQAQSLDKQLLDCILMKEVDSFENAVGLVDKLYTLCDVNWQLTTVKARSTRAIKKAINKTFRSWDDFVKQLDEINRPRAAAFMKKHSYRKSFMANAKRKEIYDKL